MTAYIYRAALIVPEAQREAANRIAEAMGWGRGCYSVPLSVDGNLPATHWGLSAAVSHKLVDALNGAVQGITPEGISSDDLSAVLPVLISAIEGAGVNAATQFQSLAQDNGLTRIQESAEEP
jgi:hypothetical protein